MIDPTVMTGIDPDQAYVRGMQDLAERLPWALHRYQCELRRDECPGEIEHAVEARAVLQLCLSRTGPEA